VGRRNRSFLRDLVDLGAIVPWWAAIGLAGFAFVLLAYLAGSPLPAPGSTASLGETVPRTVLRTAAGIGQYLVPSLLLIGAAAGFVKRNSRSRLFDHAASSGGANVQSLTWQQFEELCHEMFRRNGYSVMETRKGADGGIDLRLRKDGACAVVQCKHWKRRKVGVNIVREQLGIMTAEGVPQGYVVTSGQFTTEAISFAKGRPITLVDGAKLGRWLRAPGKEAYKIEPELYEGPSCPVCSAEMVKRTARRGQSAGSEFWGCSRFPACRGTRQVA